MDVKAYLKAGITSLGAMQMLEEAKLKAFHAGLSPKPYAVLAETARSLFENGLISVDDYNKLMPSSLSSSYHYAKGYSDGVAMKREMEKSVEILCPICNTGNIDTIVIREGEWSAQCSVCTNYFEVSADFISEYEMKLSLTGNGKAIKVSKLEGC
jgi:hypothetical protein